MKVQIKSSNQSELRINAGCLQLFQCVSFPHMLQYFKNCSRVGSELMSGAASMGPELVSGACSRLMFWWDHVCLWTSTCPGMDPTWAAVILYNGLLHRSRSLRLKFTLEFQLVQYGSTGAQAPSSPGILQWLSPKCSQAQHTEVTSSAASSKIRAATNKHWVPTDRQESEPHRKHSSLPINS